MKRRYKCVILQSSQDKKELCVKTKGETYV